MCGFAGWFDVVDDLDHPPPSARRRALDLLAPRGPDGEGTWLSPDGRAGLLHRRLAIVDVEGGAQPMPGPRPGEALAWNGELFEHRDLRARLAAGGESFESHSDTEVLLRLLAASGPDALPGLCAQYALAYVARGGAGPELLLARDPQGEKPLYVCRADGRVVFASSLDALLALAPGRRTVDREALSLYLSWGFVPAPHTIWAGVEKLRAGEWLRVGRDLDGERGRTPSRPSRPVEPDLGAALARAARVRLESADVPVGVFLSGGLDSLAVVAALRDVSDLHTYTVRARDRALDESGDASRAAAALGVAHDVIDPPDEDPDAWRHVFLRHGEPFGSASALAVDAVARAAAGRVKVVLTGDGGDEALGGYPRHVWLRRLARLPRLPGWAGSASVPGSRMRRWRRAATLLALAPADRYAAMYEVFGAWRGTLTPGDAGEAARSRVRALWGDASAGDLGAMLRVDRELELPDSHCVKVDVACMGNGVEARSPWLDAGVVAACDALPPERRIHRGVSKVALRDVLRSRLPADLAAEVFARRKRGFTTGFASALRRPDVRELLLGGSLARVPGLDASAAAALLDQHDRGLGNHVFRLSVLVALALFADAHL